MRLHFENYEFCVNGLALIGFDFLGPPLVSFVSRPADLFPCSERVFELVLILGMFILLLWTTRQLENFSEFFIDMKRSQANIMSILLLQKQRIDFLETGNQ